MTIDATHLGLVGLDTGDPNWQDAVYAALPLSEAELAETVDEATGEIQVEDPPEGYE